jgi:UDP:flavonoid glycosyltransferase YjiC (YdhE family)
MTSDRINDKQALQSKIEEQQSRIEELTNDNQALQSKVEEQRNELKQIQVKIEKLQDGVVKLQNRHSEQIGELRASSRFRIGDALVNAVRSPRGAIALPVRLWRIYKGYCSRGQSHLGSQASTTRELLDARKKTAQRSTTTAPEIRKATLIQEAHLLFMPTNGAGLGHLTRLLAIARRLKNDTRVAECVFLTTSEALNIIRQEGFVAYHFPSADLLRDRVNSKEWHSGLHNMLNMVIANHEINVFIFDGVNPYSGIKRAIGKCGDVRRVWVRRMSFKEGVEESLLEHEKFFDLQLVPGELGQKGVSQDWSGRIVVPPVVYLDRKELLSREEAIRTLGLDSGKKTVFIQLGAGNINEIGAQIEIIVDTILKFDGVQVVLANSMIAQKRLSGFENTKIIRDYPLSRYYNAFDIAVSAAGYNTLAELIYFGVPSILIPNVETVSDDQLARAKICENTGAALVLYPLSIPKLREDFEILIDDAKNAEFRKKCLILCPTSGSETAARILVEFIFSESSAYRKFKID